MVVVDKFIFLMILITPLLVVIYPFFFILIPLTIKWDKRDKEWNKYNDAFYEWKENGMQGKMPQLEDYQKKVNKTLAIK